MVHVRRNGYSPEKQKPAINTLYLNIIRTVVISYI
jgi:hypothetical protein